MAILNVLSNLSAMFGLLMLLVPTTILAQEVCTVDRGIVGTCQEIRQCPSVIRDLRNGIRFPSYCGRRVGRFPLVCCPADGNSGNPTQQRDISPPLVNFDCGITSPAPGLRPGHAIARRQISIQSSLLNSLPVENFGPPITPSLVGGEISLRQAWPWMALLGHKDNAGINWFCAGSLINEQWILTAAHCFVDTSQVNIVRLGEYDLSNSNDGVPPQDIGVETIISHPQYAFPRSYHDISLVKLARRVVIENSIRPVCLPWGDDSKQKLEGQRVTVTGWGNTAFGGSRSPVLQEVKVTVFSPERCDSSYKTLNSYSATFPQGIGSETICAGDLQGNKDACQGDSGGPMVSKNPRNNRYTIAGVVSLGYGCGLVEFPGLYVNTRRPEYLEWIKKVAF